MPMSFDTYNKCSYNCLYCFAFFQKANCVTGYNKPTLPRSVNPDRVIKLFETALKDAETKLSLEQKQFLPYIKARRIMQWGGLADGFDEWERRFGITLKLLNYFDSIDYPLSFSTKAAWWTKDARYMSLFKKHTHNWHVKISIITADKEKARALEKGVPTPEQRLEAIKRLAEIGVHVTLRLRPYIIGVSGDWKELIGRAKQAGADSVTVEFFCMESRADENLKARYAEMSKICGFDVHKFYMENSRQNGYKRLSLKIKAPIIYAMKEYAHNLGLRFHVSDMYCRECNDGCNCCGVPPEWAVSQCGQIGNAILIAKEKGVVHFSDIAEAVQKYFGHFKWQDAAGYNTSSNFVRAKNYTVTMANWLRNNWNDIRGNNSPAKGYGGILIPAGIDENGDVIYRYNGGGNDAEKSETPLPI